MAYLHCVPPNVGLTSHFVKIPPGIANSYRYLNSPLCVLAYVFAAKAVNQMIPDTLDSL
jgi:hypothetical protein